MHRLAAAGAMLIATTAAPACAATGDPVAQGPKNVPDFAPAFPEQTRAPAMTLRARARRANPWRRGSSIPGGWRSCPTAASSSPNGPDGCA